MGRETQRWWLVWGGVRVVQVRTARHVRGERDRSPGAEATIEEEGGGPITAMHHSHMHPSVLREERRPVLQGAAPLALVLPVDILARLLFSGVLPNLVAACERRDAQVGAGWQEAGGGGRSHLTPSLKLMTMFSFCCPLPKSMSRSQSTARGSVEVVRARRTHAAIVRPLSPPRSCWGASASIHWPVPSNDATSSMYVLPSLGMVTVERFLSSEEHGFLSSEEQGFLSSDEPAGPGPSTGFGGMCL
jgi:hypothetical protein